MTGPSHRGLYRSLPLVLGGLLGAALLLVAGLAGVLPIAPREQRLALALGMLGGFVLIFALCALASLRRHRWTIDADALR
jgi:ABC-type enterochelin transport system permease subunit